MTRDDGLVDPEDPTEVAGVLAAVLRTMGPGGVTDLLARLPGIRVQPATTRRFLTAAVPASVWVGEEDQFVLPDGGPVTHAQVVGGVVLHRATVGPGELPALLAARLTALARAHASYDDTAVALTAARSATDSFG